jgi:hypothetical protein
MIANGTVANDRVNKYGERLLPEAIFSAYQQQWMDVFPYTVNHDSTRRIGCSRISGIFIEPGATYLTNQMLIPENDEEKTKVDRQVKNSYISRIEKEHGHDFERLISLLSDVISEGNTRIYTDSVAIIDEGIVPRLIPELWKQLDKDGLICMSNLTPVLPGIFRHGEFLVYAHPYLRRSLSRLNGLNVPFLTCLQEKMPNAKIALDTDMIGLAGTESPHREYAYWWGPQFDNDLSKIPEGVSHFENEHYDRLMSPILHTECGWYIQDDIRTFECEEITDIQNLYHSCDMYGCRYVHSMLDAGTGLPYHLDGAIRAYDDEKMLHRLDVNLKQADRNTVYTKLWRVDQLIPVEIWKELITHYYRDNHLIGEYFGGVDQRQAKNNIDNSETHHPSAEVENDFIPANLRPGDGIRLLITLDNLEEDFGKYDVKFRPHTYTGPQNRYVRAIEYESITLRKRLNALGLHVRLPYCPRLAFNDTAFNFPIMACKSVDVANNVIAAILDFSKLWNSHNENRVISFGIKVNYSNYAVTYSFIGHIDDIVKLNLDFDYSIPAASDEIVGWAKDLRTYLDRYNISYLHPPLGAMLSSNNTLIYKRIFVDILLSAISICDDKCTAEFSVSSEIEQQIFENGITATFALNVKNSICCKCMRPYHQCKCVKFLDPQCTDNLVDFDLIGVFWTNRRA